MDELDKVLDEENFKYLEQRYPKLARALVAAVASGKTSSQIYSKVFEKSNNPTLATKVASASKHVQLLQEAAKQ